MGRVALATILLAVMVGMSGWGLHTLETNKDILLAEMEELSAMAEEGDLQRTAEAAALLADDWIERHHTLCRIVRHTQLDQVTLAVARLEKLAEYGEIGELSAEIDRCRILLSDIYDSELPLLRNIV
ncbi:MAG TPA: DUF4363 family protein [Oscillospiraceae bacterium]|nr:DUF4363 family protein [Oscillospiraceae bacterium]HNW04836.1 DUF4363 family protein [Oscillospiraceae bacterium]HPW00657.1 DUF4363 family protein [Oscillospiraceae bacterium]